MQLVLSCEHGGDRIPREFRAAFVPPTSVLASHRGHDPGTRELGALLARTCDAPLFVNTTTRLLIDANRSVSHPRRFSRWSRGLAPQLRQHAERIWSAHRDAVAAAVEGAMVRGPVVHISVHSFTPRLSGVVRQVDVGFLYDPQRTLERELVARWIAALSPLERRLRVRRNAPYRGTADGLTTALRRRFPADRYAGIELEVSQRFPNARGLAGRRRWTALQRSIAASVVACVGSLERFG